MKEFKGFRGYFIDEVTNEIKEIPLSELCITKEEDIHCRDGEVLHLTTIIDGLPDYIYVEDPVKTSQFFDGKKHNDCRGGEPIEEFLDFYGPGLYKLKEEADYDNYGEYMGDIIDFMNVDDRVKQLEEELTEYKKVLSLI